MPNAWFSWALNLKLLFWRQQDLQLYCLLPIHLFHTPVAPQIYIFHIYTGPKFKQIPDLVGTQIYTAKIYTNPFSHIDDQAYVAW